MRPRPSSAYGPTRRKNVLAGSLPCDIDQNGIAPVVIAVGLTITCVIIFIVALQLRLPLVGPWIPV